MDFKTELERYVARELLDVDSIEMNENLLAEGMVDSLGMMRLVAYIEQTWEVDVPPEDFIIDNFRTVETIDAYLHRLGAPSGNPGG